MKDITKEELAMLIITNDIAHDILLNKTFMHELKREFNIIDKSIKRIIKICFGNTELEDLDEYKQNVAKYISNLIEEKIHLSD